MKGSASKIQVFGLLLKLLTESPDMAALLTALAGRSA